MKTAVEWLVDEIEKVFVNQDIKNTKVFEQAKEMEKYEQAKAAGELKPKPRQVGAAGFIFEEYYKQTFKQQEQ